MTEIAPAASLSIEPRPLDRLKVAAVAALAFTAAASCVSIAFDINRLGVVNHLLSDASSGDLVRLQSDVAAAQTSDNQTSTIAIIELVAFFTAAICFIAWFHRAYTNLLRLGATTTRYGTGWAIGGWFVPILNFWRPKQIANDIWRGSDPGRPQEQPSWREPVSPLLWLWWAAFVVLGILDRAAAQQWSSSAHGETARSIRSATGRDIASEAVAIIAAGLAIAVVLAATRRQTERARAERTIIASPHSGESSLA